MKRGEIISISAFPTPPSREGPNSGESPIEQNGLPTIDQPIIGQAITGVGGFPVQGQLFPPMRDETTPPPVQQQLKPSEGRANSVRPKKSLFDLGKGPAGGVAATKLAISGPILQNRADDQNPLNKIATVDLVTAAKNERERRDQNALQRDSSLIAKRPAPQPPAITPEEAMKRSQSVKRKEVASATPSADDVSGGRLSVEDAVPTAVTTSAQLSPGVEEIRRRSPRLGPQPTPQEPAQLQQPARELENPRPAPPKPGQTKPEPAKTIPQRPPRPESLDIDVAPAPPKVFRPIAPAPPRFSPESVPKPVQRSQSPPRFPWEEEERRRPPPTQEAVVTAQPVQPQPASSSPPPRLPSPPQTQAGALPRAVSPEKMSTPPGMPSPPQVGRRSPPAGVGTSAIPKPPPSPPSQEPSQTQKVDARMSILPRKTSVKTDIRPSRQRPPSVEDLPSPEKPAVQRRVAAGLPGNPKAMAMKTLMNEAENKRVQTVMFVNNIEYNDPVTVRNILQGAADKVAAKNAAADAKTETASVLHRPRPIPRTRNAEENEGVPSPKSPVLQRTRSGATAERKKSILRSNPGSPTQLPPLPPAPMPKRPGNPIRPLPNDTKSMTFDEKMAMFFPAGPPSRPGSSHSNNGAGKPTLSPIPAMPALPASFLEMDGESEKEKSDRTTKTSFQTQSIVEISDLKNRGLNGRNTAKFSVDTETTTGVSQAWLPPVPSTQGLPYPTQEGKKRQSSPVLPYIPDNASVFSDGKTMYDDDATTNWGSVHSPAKAVNMRNAHQQGGPKKTHVSKKSDKEIMTIMLDDSNGARGDIAERESWFADGRTALNTSPRDLSDDSKRESRWHRRVGDECPTFSDRKEKTRSRKMVPPTPLLLRGVGNKNMVVIRAAEPSPLESPSEAYRDIQLKLKKLDDTNRDSVGSEGRKQALLDNLEQEMGQQENYWLERQNDINRDSVSTVRTSPRRDSIHEVAARAAARGQAAVKRGSLLKPTEVARVPLSSPTPPDTDESDDDAVDKRVQASKILDQPKERMSAPARLWTRAPPAAVGRNTIVHLLWAPVRPSPKERDTATLNVMTTSSIPRKASKRSLTGQPLSKIESTSLWQKPKKAHSSSGRLWGSTAPPAKQKTQNRPTTQRPARRSRRVTMLPDILESPQPLPDNHGTLGIFQFPWGEKSDTATLNSRPSHMFMAMPGTMSTGGPAIAAALEARSRQLESQEYSSSFFDDYDEELPGDADVEFDMDGSDEDFDETTLWEIASLLKTDKIPSKNSLFPTSGVENKSREATSVLGDYMDDADADSDGRKDSIIVGLDLNSSMRPKPQVQRAMTWVAPARLRSTEEPSGLFSLQHKRTDYRTTSKEPAAIHMERKSRVSHDPLPALNSSTLWKAENNRNSAPEGATRNWLMAGKIVETQEPRHRQNAADKADWEAALNEALEKSYPVVAKAKANKPVAASEEEWDSALEEAIALGGWQNIAQVEQPVVFEQERQMQPEQWQPTSIQVDNVQEQQEQWQPAPAQQDTTTWVEPVVAGYQEYFQPAIPEPTPAPVWEEPVVREQAPVSWIEPTIPEPTPAPVWVEPIVVQPAPAPAWVEPVVPEPAPAPAPVWVEPVVAGYQEPQWVEPVVAGYQEYFQPAVPEPAPAPAWEMPVVPGYLEQWGVPARQPSPMRFPQPSPKPAPEPSSFLMPEPQVYAPSPRSPARLPSLEISSTDLWQNPGNSEPQTLPANTTDLWSEGAVSRTVGEPIAAEMTPPNSSRPRPSETEEALPVFAPSQQMWQREEAVEPQAENWLDTMVVNQQQQQPQEEVRGVVFRY